MKIRVFIAVTFSFLVLSCGETKTIYCGPNKTNPMQVLRNPTKAYPVYAKEYDNSIKANVKILDEITVDVEPKLKSEVVELRQKLNQEASKMEMLVKTAYFAFNQDCCSESGKAQFHKMMTLLAEKSFELDRLNSNLKYSRNKDLEGDVGVAVDSMSVPGGDDNTDDQPVTETSTRQIDIIKNFKDKYKFQK